MTYLANLRRFMACRRTSDFCSFERRSVTSRRLASRIRGLMTSLEGGAGMELNDGAGRAKCREGSWCGCECGCWGAIVGPSSGVEMRWVCCSYVLVFKASFVLKIGRGRRMLWMWMSTGAGKRYKRQRAGKVAIAVAVARRM